VSCSLFSVALIIGVSVALGVVVIVGLVGIIILCVRLVAHLFYYIKQHVYNY